MIAGNIYNVGDVGIANYALCYASNGWVTWDRHCIAESGERQDTLIDLVEVS